MDKNTKTIPMEIIIMNPKRGSKHKCPCLFPDDCLTMTEEVFSKAYGPHIIQAAWDLLQHPSFKQGLDKPKLILAT